VASARPATRATSLRDDRGVLSAIAIDEDDVVSRILKARKYFECTTGDQARSHVVVAQGSERVACDALVLRLDVDRRQHTLVGHAGEQCSSGDSGACADFNDGRCIY